ncbi:MAG: hypothetical protein QM677_01080 [Microbacterium sp.]
MFFGLDAEKLILIAVLAALVIGPERLPSVAQWLARTVVRVRDWSRTAKDRLKEEMGDDFDDVEWRKLDPRQYDPRRIVRDALIERPTPARPVTTPAPVAPAAESVAQPVPLRPRLDPITAPHQPAVAAASLPAAEPSARRENVPGESAPSAAAPGQTPSASAPEETAPGVSAPRQSEPAERPA